MTSRYDPIKHRRRSLRLQGYDYRQAGAYFVTLCVQDRALLFGAVEGCAVRLNHAGQMIESAWLALQQSYPGVETDAFVVMPNHLHGILLLAGAVQPQPVAATYQALSLPDVVQRFKTLTTRLFVNGVKHGGWPPFPGRLWQRNYFEHVVRGEESLHRLRRYISDNPARWNVDAENPMLRPDALPSPYSSASPPITSRR